MGEPNEVNKRHCTVTISLQIEILNPYKEVNIKTLRAVRYKFRPHRHFKRKNKANLGISKECRGFFVRANIRTILRIGIVTSDFTNGVTLVGNNILPIWYTVPIVNKANFSIRQPEDF